MRQSLIIGARPQASLNKAFPRVPLEQGTWKIVIENQKDSVIQVLYTTTVTDTSGTFEKPVAIEIKPMQKEVHLLTGPTKASATIVKAGTEEYISVFAEAMK